MNRFIIIWSLIHPLCLGLIESVIVFSRSSWYPGDSNIWKSIAIYSAYWLLLGILQGRALLWEFCNRQLAYRWFFVTSATGFLAMLLHELFLSASGVDLRGQGILFLMLTLPFLIILGGITVGLAQFLLIRNYYKTDLARQRLNTIWFTISFISWITGFAGIFYVAVLPLSIPLVAAGGAMKALFIKNNLRV